MIPHQDPPNRMGPRNLKGRAISFATGFVLGSAFSASPGTGLALTACALLILFLVL